MSYVLHIWEQPKASTVKEADSITSDAYDSKVGQNRKFIAFAKGRLPRFTLTLPP